MLLKIEIKELRWGKFSEEDLLYSKNKFYVIEKAVGYAEIGGKYTLLLNNSDSSLSNKILKSSNNLDSCKKFADKHFTKFILSNIANVEQQNKEKIMVVANHILANAESGKETK